MIFFNPVTNDPLPSVKLKPKNCFLITQLGHSPSKELQNIKKQLKKNLKKIDFEIIDANVRTTGKDF